MDYFEVGERVKVVDNLKDYSTGISDYHKIKLAGKPAVILKADKNGDRGKGDYKIGIDGIPQNWSWSGEWLQRVSKINENTGENTMKNVTFNGKDIKRVIFSGDATVVLFSDGTKSVTKRLESDADDKEKAIAMALVKSVYGKNYYQDLFERFIPTEKVVEVKEVEKRPIKIGDRVRIKSWEKMVEEFGIDGDGDIYIEKDDAFFTEECKYVCGKELVIEDIDTDWGDNEIYIDEENSDPKIVSVNDWKTFTLGMVEHIN